MFVSLAIVVQLPENVLRSPTILAGKSQPRRADTLHVLGERRLQEIVFLKPDGAKLR